MGGSKNEYMLNAVGLSVGYGTRVLLSGIQAGLCRGRLVALLGGNGAGKSTLLRALTMGEGVLAGDVLVGETLLQNLSRKELARKISIVGTERILAGGLTVEELVGLGRQPYTGFLGRLDKDDHKVVANCLERVGITHKAKTYTSELSDGERQKAMIAKALAQNTPIIVLDEPTAFLDTASRISTMQLLHRLAHEEQKAVLLSSHDISLSLLLADELWVITAQRDFCAGTTELLVADGTVERLFDSDSLEFNEMLCDYTPSMPVTMSVNLQCDVPQLKRAVERGLNRHAIGVNPNSTNTVQAISPTLYIIDGKRQASTILEVVQFLQ